MPEDGCSIVKTEMVSIAGRAQPGVVPALTRPSTLDWYAGSRGNRVEQLWPITARVAVYDIETESTTCGG